MSNIPAVDPGEEHETQVLSNRAVSLIEACEELCNDPLVLHVLASHLPDSNHDKPFLLAYNGDQCIDNFTQTGITHFLDTAILTCKASIHSFQSNTQIPEICQHIPLVDLGTAYSARYDIFKRLPDLNGVINAFESALKLGPLEDATVAHKIQGDLAGLLLRRFDRTCEVTDLKRAVSLLQKRWMASPGNKYNLLVHINNLAGALQGIFEFTQDKQSLHAATTLINQVVGDNESLNRSLVLTTRGTIYLHRYERSGKLDDLEIAITSLNSAIKEGQDETDVRYNNLGCALLARYERLGEVEDINKAFDICTKAVSLSSELHFKAQNLGNLGLALLRKFEHDPHMEDINAAIETYETALKLSSSTGEIAKKTSSLSKVVLARFKFTQDFRDLEHAVELGRRVQAMIVDIPNASLILPGLLTNIGSIFFRRFEALLRLSDIDEAIFSLRRAVDLTPRDHPDLRLRLMNLGNTLVLRFQLLKEKRDIDEALELQGKAIQPLCRDNRHILPNFLTNYGNALMRRSEHTGEVEDIYLAVEAARRAVDSVSSSTTKAEVLHNAAIALLRLHDFTEELKDVNEAISYFEHAMAHTGLSPDVQQHILSSFGVAYLNRFTSTKSIEDLNRSIDLLEESMQLAVKSNNHYLGGVRLNLGKSLMRRFDLSSDANDFRRVVCEYKLAALSTFAPPSMRLDACQRWASSSEDVREKLAAYEIAFEQIPLIAWLGQSISTRQERIRTTVQGISSAAAATALVAGNEKLAVQWLEQGRAIIWNQLRLLRSPFDELKGHPELVEELKYIAGQLERASTFDSGTNLKNPSIPGDIIQEEDIQAGHRWAERWDELLKQVRSKDGLGNFLKPPTISQIFEDLKTLDGFVVMVNVYLERCDALVLDPGSNMVLHIPLPNFSFKMAELLQKEMVLCLENHGLRNARKGRKVNAAPRNKGNLNSILAALWGNVVKPIVAHLCLKKSQPQHKQIWWCPTGPLSFLPIHAAGIYSMGMERVSLADFAISSYIPALSALQDTLKRTVVNGRHPLSDMLIVTQAHTPGLTPIPSTQTESELIIKKATNAGLRCTHLEGKHATVGTVLEDMSTHSLVHFACHALQDPTDPIKSAFYLCDGALTMSQIIMKQLPLAEFAFLSACQTGMGDERMSEEAAHLAGGMLAAGYKSIIATMWAINDTNTPMVADIVYEELLSSMENIRPAKALHRAGVYLRERLGYEDWALLTWISFVHTGLY